MRTTREILQTWSLQHDSPVTSIQVFTAENQVPCPAFLEGFADEAAQDERAKISTYNLLVTTALEPAVVYRNILITGFEDSLSLPNSEKFDSTLCSCVVDIDFDGQNELLVGTYGQELLAYKYFEEKPESSGDQTPSQSEASKNNQSESSKNDQSDSRNLGSCLSMTTNHSMPSPEQIVNSLDDLSKQRHRSDESNAPATTFKDIQPPRKFKSQEDLSGSAPQTGPVEPGSDLQARVQPAGFQLLWQRSFPGPVVGLDKLDIMGDGMDDLVVVTLKGMHILQPDLAEVAKVCRERLRGLCDSSSEADDMYLDLQKETFGR